MKTQSTQQQQQQQQQLRQQQQNQSASYSAQSVQERAYELYLKRGQVPGHELDDWLQAEEEIRRQKQQRA